MCAPSGGRSGPAVGAVGENDGVLATAVPESDAFVVTVCAPDGQLPQRMTGAAVAELEASAHPRWIFDSTADDYPALLRAGIRVRRSHDIALIERILLARAGRFDEPVRAGALLARAGGRPVPADPAPPDLPGRELIEPQPVLFGGEPADAAPPSPVDLFAAYADQMERVEESAGGASARNAGVEVSPGALRLLLAAESGSALVAAEMTARGLPWDAGEHRRILERLLGPRPPEGQRPARLAALAGEITAAFGFPVNPDSPLEVKEALRRHGFEIESTRAWVLQSVDHPAIAPLLAYKDLVRLWTANGWHWLDEWISADGRLTAQFLPGAVVTGRWATRGGGGLQLPRAVRAAAVANDGYALVVADAAQLEPRILAAVSGDAALAALAREDDLYSALAADGFGGDRGHAKLAMLGAMYGQTSGEAARLMATMRVRYPVAVGHVETAALRGETGQSVRSVLGRACPPPSERWRRIVGEGADAARRVARDRGRFTRNFVIQASAADWAAVWMTALRLALLDVPGAELVLFQHDELVVHAPLDATERVCELVIDTARTAGELVFPGSSVSLPVRPAVVARYSDAK